jgi:hypothetical protein
MNPLIFTLCMSVSGGCTPVSIETMRCLERHHVDFEIVDNDPQGTKRNRIDRRVVALWPHACQLGANK